MANLKQPLTSPPTASSDSPRIKQTKETTYLLPRLKQYFEFSVRVEDTDEPLGLVFGPHMSIRKFESYSPLSRKVQPHDVFVALAGRSVRFSIVFVI